jgi:hypothetical protein
VDEFHWAKSNSRYTFQQAYTMLTRTLPLPLFPVFTEMDYNAATEVEPAGEVLLRGPQLFSGYYKQVGAWVEHHHLGNHCRRFTPVFILHMPCLRFYHVASCGTASNSPKLQPSASSTL